MPHRIGRHVHPQARPDLPPPAATKTGVDYLALIAQQHRAQIADQINYRGMLPAAEPTDDVDVDADARPELNAALEAELASFALLGKETVSTEIPGQLDLNDLTDHPTAGSGDDSTPARDTDD